MKRIKIIALLLILVLMYCNIDVGAGEYSDDMKVLPVMESTRLLSPKPALDTGKYTTIEKAANQVRTKVRKHYSKVNVYFKTAISSPSEAYEKFKTELTKETDNSSEGDYMYWDIRQEIPNFICVPVNEKGKIYYYYEFHINYDYYTTLGQRKRVDRKINNIIQGFDFHKKTSNLQKVKTIYEYICKNVRYAYNAKSNIVFTSYSALFNNEAVCQGYAQLLYKMLKEVNVPVRLIPGYANGELHGWNIVKIGKYYYNVDVTWDAENYQRGYEYKNFLKGDGFANHNRFYDYQTDEFYGTYPMAKYDYGKEEQRLSMKSVRAKFKIKRPIIRKNNGRNLILKKMGNNVKYTIQIAPEYNLKKVKEVTVKKTNVILQELESKKNYYIRYRAFKKIHGKIVYTRWSDRKLVEMN